MYIIVTSYVDLERTLKKKLHEIKLLAVFIQGRTTLGAKWAQS